MKRRAAGEGCAKFLGVWLPRGLVVLLEAAVACGDTDRSKFVRLALTEKMEKLERRQRASRARKTRQARDRSAYPQKSAPRTYAPK